LVEIYLVDLYCVGFGVVFFDVVVGIDVCGIWIEFEVLLDFELLDFFCDGWCLCCGVDVVFGLVVYF